MQLLINPSPRHGQPLTPGDRQTFGPGAISEVREYMALVEHAVTPLHRMDALARALGIGQMLVKDESSRSSLGSFKALGGAYAVVRMVQAEAERRLKRSLTADELRSAPVRQIARTLTVACATDGNHGRSVASGARVMGCNAVIFIHAGVSEARAAALRDLGAHVVRVSGTYDDSVAAAARAAKENDWQIVSDTSWPGYEDIPGRVMQGYLVLVDETLHQCRQQNCWPTHIFLQAGVGGFAAAVAAHWILRDEGPAPRFIVVEPDRAACLLQSAAAQEPVRIAAGEPTVMAMLECYEPSLIAWRILERLAHAFVAIGDAAALRALRRLAHPLPPDPFVLSGESGGAGLAGLMEVAREAQTRELLGLDPQAVALVFNTEGATDRELYESLLAAADPDDEQATSGVGQR